MNGSKTVVRLGIDVGKNSFHVWGVNEQDERVLKKQVRRSALVREVAKLPACLIGMEACGGAHHWGREFSQHGHEVRLMAPQFVTGYVRATGMITTMRRPSARRWGGPTCISWRSRQLSRKTDKHDTGFDRRR